KAILEHFNIALFETLIETVGDSESPEIRWTNKPALSLEIRSIKHPHLDGPVDSPARISREAYAIFLGTLQFLKEPALSQTQLEVQIVSSSSRQPVAGARVALDGTFPLVTDLAGKVVFRGIQPRRYRVVIQTAGEASQEIEVDWVNRSTSVVIEIR
ncbi:MAG: carboxypeptidase-like regulatory domain-containing protein, partial [Candidatus Poribacteria bacterium]|nr:carboxypeptidase-like regulatory domain-containing protein [Candidatus Poribacteria bacterium]